MTRSALAYHTRPISTGYRIRIEYRRGERIPVPYAGTALAIDGLIASS